MTGIVLIVLALCGIGFVVYLQFFQGRRRGRSKKNGAAPAKDVTAAPDVYGDGYEYYDDQEPVQDRGYYDEPDDPYSDRYDVHPGEDHYVDITSSRGQGEPYVDISGDDPEEFVDISSGRTDTVQQTSKTANPASSTGVQEKPRSENESDFNWDKFFEDSKK